MRSKLRTLPFLPFTLVMMAGLTLVAIFTNTYFEQITKHWINRIGFAPRDFWYMRYERMFSSALVTSGGKVFWQALFLVGLWSAWQNGSQAQNRLASLFGVYIC